MNSRSLQKANEHRAKIITFYLNGEPFNNHFKVTIVAGRNLSFFHNLLNYLTERANIPIKYIFDTQGERITSVDQLIHNKIYICSKYNKFYFAHYGKINPISNKSINVSKSFQRPLSSKNKYNIEKTNSEFKNLKIGLISENKKKDIKNKKIEQNYKGKVVTVINNKLPCKYSRVLLNLNNAQSFENVLKDLGESVLLLKPNILLTTSGKEIKSISQLKDNLNKDDIVYVDDLFMNNNLNNFQTNYNDCTSSSLSNKLSERKKNESLILKPNSSKIEKNLNYKNINFKVDNDSNVFKDTSVPQNQNLKNLNKNLNNETNFQKITSQIKNDKDEIKYIEPNTDDYFINNLNNNDSKIDESKLDGSLLKFEKKTDLSNDLNNFKINNNFIKENLLLDLDKNFSVKNDVLKINENNKIFESYLVIGEKIPKEKFILKNILGYNGNTINNNLLILPSGEFVYFVSLFVVFCDSINKQRFYYEHSEDICCISINYNNNCIASGQKAFYTAGRNDLPIVNVWDYNTLETKFTTNEFDLGTNLLSLDFSKSGFLAIIALKDNNIHLYYWDWKNKFLIAKENKLLKNEEVYGIVFYPNDENLMITYGKHHLYMWKLNENKKLVVKKSYENIFKKKNFTINRLSFLFNHQLIAVDSNGSIIILNENSFEVSKKKAHDASISALLVFPNNYIVTGDVLGVLKTWSYESNQLNLMNIATLPTLSGSINSLIFTNYKLLNDFDYFLNNVHDDKLYKIYIGTSTNMIFSGSALQATQHFILFEGHVVGVRAIAADFSEKYFYTSGIDHKICKWYKNLLVWCVNNKYQSVSMAVYPTGGTLAVGCTNGVICILSTISGELLNIITLSDSSIGCLGYSPNSLLLSAGTQNGTLHIFSLFNNGTSLEQIFAMKCNCPILTLQWSLDCKYILTSVNDNQYQELILWDLIENKFMKGVSVLTEKNYWFNATCCSGDDVIGTWDNKKLKNVINLCCHVSPSEEYVVAGDEHGNVRLFSYPCTDKNAAFYVIKQSSNPVTEVRFLKKSNVIISASFDGVVYIWETISVMN